MRVGNVTGKTWQVSPGQQIELEVDRGTGGAPAPYEWTIPKLTDNLATTSAISNYVIDTGPNPGDNYAQVKLLDAAHLHDNAVTFRFVHTCRFKVSVNTGTGDANTTFEVISPEIINPFYRLHVSLKVGFVFKHRLQDTERPRGNQSTGIEPRSSTIAVARHRASQGRKVTALASPTEFSAPGPDRAKFPMVQLFTKASSNGLQQNNVVVRSADDELVLRLSWRAWRCDDRLGWCWSNG